MKKILGVSLVALMAVSTARADIASKAYVDSGAGTYISASNTAGQNIKALDTAIGVLPVDPNGENGARYATVADAIAGSITEAGGQTAAQVSSAISTALANSGNAYQTASDVTETIQDLDGALGTGDVATGNVVTEVTEADGVVTVTHGNAVNAVASTASSGTGNVITGISLNSDGKTIDFQKGITALVASDIDQTYDATSAHAQSGTAVAQAISNAGGQTAQQVSTAIDTKVATLDKATDIGSGNVVASVAQTDGIVTATMGTVLDTVNAATGGGNVVSAISVNSTNANQLDVATITVIPAPNPACADATNKCVLTSDGTNYAWEVVAR